MSNIPNKLCVLADQYVMTNEAETLENAIRDTDIDVPLVLVNTQPDSGINPTAEADAVNNGIGIETFRVFADVVQQERAWALVLAEKKIAEQLGSTAAATGRVPIEEVSCLSDAEFRHVEPLVEGPWRELPADVVDLVQTRCDLGIRFGFGLLRGDILRAPAFGILSFHPANIREYRGLGVPQAWLDGRERMGVTLQRLTDEIDAGEIIAYEETDVSGARTLWEVYDILHEVQADLLATGITNLRDPTFEPITPDSLGPYYSIERKRRLSFAGRTLAKNTIGYMRGVAR